MKILVAQPTQESSLEQLYSEITQNPNVDVILFPEGYIKKSLLLETVQCLSKKFETMIITGYLSDNKKDRAIIISQNGDIILDRAKTPVEVEQLIEPVVITHNEQNIGYLLCMEILKGLTGFVMDRPIHFIAHPIGTGMFSDEQFLEWTGYAASIAKKYNCFVLGTSHADGSFQNCGFSIPIAYCFDPKGKPLFISKSDTRTRIVDLNKKEVHIL